MTGTAGVACSGAGLVVTFRWLFRLATEGPSAAPAGAGAGLFIAWVEQHIERVLTASYLPAVFILVGTAMTAIGIVQLIRKR